MTQTSHAQINDDPGCPILNAPSAFRVGYRALIISVFFFLGFSLSAQTTTHEIAQRVDRHYNNLKSLKAEFTESYEGLGRMRTESGTLLLQKPGRMRWDYSRPAGKLFLLDGKYAWFYSKGDPQVQRIEAKKLDDLRSPLRLLLGHTQLAKELDNITVTPDGPNFRISGIPKGMAERVRQLALTVTPAGIIQSMKIEETDGATTSFAFTDQQENVVLPASEFTFTPPPNVSIANGESPI